MSSYLVGNYSIHIPIDSDVLKLIRNIDNPVVLYDDVLPAHTLEEIRQLGVEDVLRTN